MGRELNKGEASHELSRFLCFGKEGTLRRPADTPIRRHADTPIRQYADSPSRRPFACLGFFDIAPSALNPEKQAINGQASGVALLRDRRCPRDTLGLH
jgi:hypothetical protein